MDRKYAKGTSIISVGVPFGGIVRIRGGPGYLSIRLMGVDFNFGQYCPLSKGCFKF